MSPLIWFPLTLRREIWRKKRQEVGLEISSMGLWLVPVRKWGGKWNERGGNKPVMKDKIWVVELIQCAKKSILFSHPPISQTIDRNRVLDTGLFPMRMMRRELDETELLVMWPAHTTITKLLLLFIYIFIYIERERYVNISQKICKPS